MTTPNIGLIQPTVGGDFNVWGGYWNTNASTIDTIFNATSATPVAINHTGETVNSTAESFFFKNTTDATKYFSFGFVSSGPSAWTTATTRVFSLPLPAADDALVSETSSQTLTNKTVNGGTFTGNIAGTPTLTDDVKFGGSVLLQRTTQPQIQLTNAAVNKGYRLLSDIDTSTNDGLKLQVQSSGWLTAMTIAADQGVTIGAPTSGSKGAGSLNVQDLYVNGVSLNPASSNAVARAWVRFTVNTSATPPVTMQNNYNVSSVTRSAKGVYVVTFTATQPNADYVAVCGGPPAGSSTLSVTAQTTATLTVTMGGSNEATAVNVVVFGD